jgi:hypothetical protein
VASVQIPLGQQTNPPIWDKAAVVNDLMRKYYIDDENWNDGYEGGALSWLCAISELQRTAV